jgi:phage gp29-like protein
MNPFRAIFASRPQSSPSSAVADAPTPRRRAAARPAGVPLEAAGGLPPIREDFAAPVPSVPPTPLLAARLPDTAVARILRPQAAARWLMPSVASITPQYIEFVLRGALNGSHQQQWELFDLMEDTWPRLMKNLNEVKRAAVQMQWNLQPWAEEDTAPTPAAIERQKLVSSAIWKMRPDPASDDNDFQATVYDILDAWGKGTAVLQVIWEMRRAGQLGDITAPQCTRWVHPQNYAWNETGTLGLTFRQPQPGFISNPGTQIIPFPEHEFLVALCKAKTGHPLAGALLRPLAWWWCSANFSADWLLNLAQVFGLPFRWANYAQGTPQATVDAICSMLQNMGSAGWGAFPEGATLEFKESSKGGDNSPQGDLLDRADTVCDLLVLGQTLTTEMSPSGGSFAAAKVHKGVRDEVLRAAAEFAAKVINKQLIPSILTLNYGNADEAPEFYPERETISDAKADADRDAVLLQTGMKMPLKWFHKRHNVPLPAEGEEVVEQAAPDPMADLMRPGQRAELPAPRDEEDPEGEDAEKLEARRAGDSAAMTRQQLVQSVAADLQPVRERIGRLLQIRDDAIFATKLKEFRAELQALKRDIVADPATARELERLMAAALAVGLTRRTAPNA